MQVEDGRDKTSVRAVILKLLAESAPPTPPAGRLRFISFDNRGAAIQRMIESMCIQRGTDDPEIQSTSFIRNAMRLAAEGKGDEGIDLVFDSVDSLLKCGAFDVVSNALAECDVATCPSELLMTLIATTFPAREEINSRATFIASSLSVLRNREEVGVATVDRIAKREGLATNTSKSN